MSTHVVLGAGAIGRALAEALAARGRTVRLVSRSGSPWRGTGDVAVVSADVADGASAIGAAAGADVVYQVMNPPYARWREEFPPLQRNALAAAERAGARYVRMDNLYVYGVPDGPLTEDSAPAPSSAKGRLRGKMAGDVLAAHHEGRVEAVIGRASDYFGPGAGAQSNLGDRVIPAALEGRTARVLGNPDLPHTYSYVPDVAEGLAVLGEHPDAPGRIWFLPNDLETRTTRSLVETVFALAGHPVRLKAIPDALISALGLVSPAMRAVAEMEYLYDVPYVVDSSRIRELGATATPLDEALAATVAAARP